MNSKTLLLTAAAAIAAASPALAQDTTTTETTTTQTEPGTTTAPPSTTQTTTQPTTTPQGQPATTTQTTTTQPTTTPEGQPAATTTQTTTTQMQVTAATADDIKKDVSVYDQSGELVGKVDSVDSDGAIVNTGKARAEIPLTSFGKNDKGLVVSVTKADLDAKAKTETKPKT